MDTNIYHIIEILSSRFEVHFISTVSSNKIHYMYYSRAISLKNTIQYRYIKMKINMIPQRDLVQCFITPQGAYQSTQYFVLQRYVNELHFLKYET